MIIFWTHHLWIWSNLSKYRHFLYLLKLVQFEYYVLFTSMWLLASGRGRSGIILLMLPHTVQCNFSCMLHLSWYCTVYNFFRATGTVHTAKLFSFIKQFYGWDQVACLFYILFFFSGILLQYVCPKFNLFLSCSFSDFFPRESSCLVMHMEDYDPVRAYIAIIYYWSMSCKSFSAVCSSLTVWLIFLSRYSADQFALDFSVQFVTSQCANCF